MSNLYKRILTSIIIFPFSIFFIYKGGNFLVLFLIAVFLIANYELFTSFKKKFYIIILNFILIFSLYSIYYLSKDSAASFVLLIWVIILTVCSDIGGYIFGKLFKWKKITKISPNKTFSGVLGSFIFSLVSLFILNFFVNEMSDVNDRNFLQPYYFFLALVFSLTAQVGDLTISYFKRLEKIKDAGKLLPGHGGIFDRIDGLMFVVIIAFILYKFNTF